MGRPSEDRLLSAISALKEQESRQDRNQTQDRPIL